MGVGEHRRVPPTQGYGGDMDASVAVSSVSAEPTHVPSGSVLLALALSDEARGIRGLDRLRRSVDRAPPQHP